jgi:outer membrane lipoprotein LolB
MRAALQRWHRLLWALPLFTLLLAGCARPVQKAVSDDVAAQSYSGRLSLSLQTDPPQSFFAGFDLRGSPQAGELVLATPLGGTLARISWNPAGARLQPASGEAQQFADLPGLMQALTGTAVPVAALFDWLSGRQAPIPGWQADLSLREQGRLSARRDTPAPAAELRLILD